MQIGRLYPSYEPLDPSKHQFLAACSLYQATGEARYWKETQTYQQLSQNRQGWPVLNFDNPYWQGLLCVARSSPEPRERSTARDTIYARMLQRWIDDDSRYLLCASTSARPFAVRGMLCRPRHAVHATSLPERAAASKQASRMVYCRSPSGRLCHTTQHITQRATHPPPAGMLLQTQPCRHSRFPWRQKCVRRTNLCCQEALALLQATRPSCHDLLS